MRGKNSWTKFRFTNLLIGFIFSLCFCLLAFNYTAYKVNNHYTDYSDQVEETEIHVVRTVHPKKEVKKLQVPEKIEAIDVKQEISGEFEFEMESIDISEEIRDTLFIADVISTEAVPVHEMNTVPPSPKPDLNNTPEDIYIPIAETMPYYGDCALVEGSKKEKKMCSDQAFLKYLRDNLRYPRLAVDNEIEGTVIINLFIDQEGNLDKAEIFRDVPGGCGKEALRVVQSMKKWSPAKQRGRPVKVVMKLPVVFELH